MRVVQMYGVDLGLFQFHRQLTWAAMFLNADGTIYGRYGSRGPRRGMRDNDRDISIDGFKEAMRGALELHEAYPANREALARKRGPSPLVKTPERLPAAPAEQARPARAGEHGCIHCHQVQDWEMLSVWKSATPVPDELLWPYPMPDALGLTLDTETRATVSRVAERSAAARAGFEPGDRIVLLDGQPIISIADVQWALHRAKEPSVLEAEVDRGGRRVRLELEVRAGWRRTLDFADTLSLGWVTRMQLAGMRCDALPPEEKRGLGLAADALALRIRDITPERAKYRNPSARRIGLRKGDVITAVDGRKTAMTETEFLSYLVQKKAPGQTVDLGYLRGGQVHSTRLELP